MTAELKQSIARFASQIGFDLVGVSAPVIDDRCQRAYREWLAAGRYGRMDYLTRHLGKRMDPTQLVPGTKSVICVIANYYQTAATDADMGRVATYAWGCDYHRVVTSMLHRLAEQIETLVDRRLSYRAFVDTAPVLEKALAWQAGLGWIGKNGCLINRKAGSYVVLGELFVDVEIEPDQPGSNHCGACRQCMDRCPTGAIVEPFVVDARRCISYLTIEHRRPIDPALAEKTGGWIFGCDVCQQVCPFNRFAKTTTIDDFLRHRLGPQVDPTDVLSWDETTYRSRVADTAGCRASLAQWQRNASL